MDGLSLKLDISRQPHLNASWVQIYASTSPGGVQSGYITVASNMTPSQVGTIMQQPSESTIEGYYEALAERAFLGFRDLWVNIDQADDIDVFRSDLVESISSGKLEQLRRTLLEWGHGLDMLGLPDRYTELVVALANRSEEQLALNF